MKPLQILTPMKGIYGHVLWHTVRSCQEVEPEVWTSALQHPMHSLFSTKVFPFSVCNLNLDKSDEENKISIFKAWSHSKTTYMASLWQIWILKFYFLHHCYNRMGILKLKILFWYSTPSLLLFLVNLFESGSALTWVFELLPISPLLNIFRTDICNRKGCTAPATWPVSFSIHNQQREKRKKVCPVERQKQQS